MRDVFCYDKIMKLTVLGSGVSITFPGTGFRYSSAHLIEVGNRKILFDAGIGVLPQIARLGVTLPEIDTICISHFHADHFVLEPILQAYYLHAKLLGQKIHLRILGPSDIQARVEAAYKTKGWTFTDDLLTTIDLTFTSYTDGEPMQLNETIKLTPNRTQHYQLEAYALRLETSDGILAYSGDSAHSEGLEAAAAHADIFLCESFIAIDKQPDDGHVGPKQAGEIALKQNCKQLILTHYTGVDSAEDMTTAAQSSGYSGPISVAKDLDTYRT